MKVGLALMVIPYYFLLSKNFKFNIILSEHILYQEDEKRILGFIRIHFVFFVLCIYVYLHLHEKKKNENFYI